MTTVEQWVPILRFPRYEVSSYGRVRRIRRVGGAVRRLSLHCTGYLQIQLRNAHGQHTVLVHRLVAAAFLPQEADKQFVDHIDGDSANNVVTNLRWVDLATNSVPRRVRGRTCSSQPVPRPDAVWKSIPGFPMYAASSCGVIRRISVVPGSSGSPLRPWLSRSGYLQVALCVDGKKFTQHVHSLAAAAFHGPCPEGLIVDHCDGVKTHNAATNLEYVTRSENAKRFEKTLGPNNRGLRKLTEEAVRDIKRRIANGESLKSIRLDHTVAPHTLSNIKTGRTWRNVA